LTAVAPNQFLPPIKGPATAGPPRFWYRIGLRHRHRPDVFVPRIVDKHVRAYWNVARASVVDANFSTLLCENARVTPPALMAVLHSSWLRAMAEEIATPLGGGALKVEATHLRTVTLPEMTGAEWEALDRIGRMVSNADADFVESVDDVVMGAAARALSISASIVLREVTATATRAFGRRTRAA
jgi:hypothetical protein